jgi:predicted amidohydrolase YtcJ
MRASRFCGPLLLAAIAACASAQTSPSAAPDLLLVGGKVFTSDNTRPWAEALAIRGDRIVAVGSSAEVRALASPSSRVIDVGGRVVVPGFNDAHDHISGAAPGTFIASGAPMVDPTAAQLLDSIRAVVARVPPGSWIRSDLWVAALKDTLLRRPALDQVAPAHPVMLVMPTGHGVILNSVAMRALGISETEPDPLGGWYERDDRGRITGRLDEYAGWRAIRAQRITQPESTLVTSLRRYGEREARLGITSTQIMAHNMDAGVAIRTLTAAALPLRIRIFRFSIPTASSLGLDQWSAAPTRPSPLLTVGGVKWILDGTPIEQNAPARRAYAGRPGWHGRLNFPLDSMRVILAQSLRSSEPLALHVAGDSTAILVLGLMESLAPDSAWRRRRVRIEHGGASVHPDMWPRASSKGIVIVNNLPLLPPPAVSRSLPKVPLAGAFSKDMVMAFGSDGEPRSPFVGMRYALAFPYDPQVPRELLVLAYTLGSAYAEFEESRKGSIAPGKLADVAVLSQDIFIVPIDELPKTESVLTLVGGRIVWDAKVVR